MRTSVAILTRVLLAGGLAVTGAFVAAPAHALSAPDGVRFDLDAGNAMVSWDRQPEATSYVVQVDNDADFTSVLFSQATDNHVFVPPTQLPTGMTLYARVQSKQGNTPGQWSSTVEYQRERLSAPANPTPATGTTLPSGAAPTFRWDSIAGTTNYQIRIATTSSSECETAQVKNGGWTSESTEFVLRDRVLAPNQPYHWCVRASLPDGVFSEWTEPQSFQVGDLGQPTLARPGMGEEVRDVTLDWDPVDGAAKYRLQVGWDQEFGVGVRFDTQLSSTQWSPNPKVLDNRTWYWRVAAIDASNNQHAWSNVRTFVRAWRDQPTLQYPADDEQVATADMYYEWGAVPRADYYTLQTSPNADFTPANAVTSCRTSHTTYVGECGGNPNGWTYWRVLANEDRTLGINAGGSAYEHTTQTEIGASTQIRRYQSVIARPEKTAPANNRIFAADEVPTLTWKPVTFAATYLVKVTNTTTGATITKETNATSFTPRTLLAAGTYQWDVALKTIDGVSISYLELSSQPQFTVSDYSPTTATSGSPALLTDGASGYRPPALAWQPVTEATKYVVRIRRPDDTGWLELGESFAYPAGESATDARFLAPGTYAWKVAAYKNSAQLAESSEGSFTIEALYDPASVTTMSYADWLDSTEISAALGGNAMYGNAGEVKDRCVLTTVLTEDAGCFNLRETPVIGWQPKAGHAENPNIAFYKLSLFADQARTTPVPGYRGVNLQNVQVRGHAWLPPVPIADAQAGQEGETSAYWVQLIPCSYTGCATSASTDPSINQPLAHAFNKSYDQAVALSPVGGATVETTSAPGNNDLVFVWKDMLAAQAAAPDVDTSLTASKADTEASVYQLTYSRFENFTNATTVFVDHTFYTPPNLLGDGDVYWKVRAIDDGDNPLGAKNPMNWSDQQKFTITSKKATGLSPSDVSTVMGSRQALSWSAAPYASKYVIEVYAGDVPAGSSTTDRKVNDTVFARSWTPSALLAAGPYTWRVRGIDAGGQAQQWSDWAHFTVAPESPTMLDAPAGANIAPQDLFMSWTGVDGANGYRVEWRVKDSTTVNRQDTTALAWAPTGALKSAGEWEWRVSTLRGSAVWGSPTAWRTFSVALKPTATTDVSIPSTGAVDSNLILTPPVWDFGGDATTTYQWYRGNTEITDATGTIYRLIDEDFGKPIKVVATLKVPGYQDGTSTSNVATVTTSEAATTVVTAPVISGDAHATSTLTVTTEAVWSNGAATTYQWLRDGNAINGKSGVSYVVQGADAGHTLSVRATGKRTGYADGETTSNVIHALSGPAATNTRAPEITGGTPVGSTLSLSTQPAWSRAGQEVTNCTVYSWLRDGLPIPGATRETYRTTDPDANQPITVSVTCVQAGYETSEGVVSNPIVPIIGPAPTPQLPPVISGTPAAGHPLKASVGSWPIGNGTYMYTFQWLRNGAPIPGATRDSYVPNAADVGMAISVVVTADADGYAPGTATSSSVVVAPDPNAKVSSSTTITSSSKKVRKGKKVTLTAAVSASGRTGLGTVVIEIQIPKKSGVKTKTVTLDGANSGSVKVKLKAKGKYQFRAVYKGMTNVTGSSSAWVKVKAR